MSSDEEVDYRMETYPATLQSLAWAGLMFFLVAVVSLSVVHGRTLFLSIHGWSHRLLGGLLLLWLLVGACTCHTCSTNATMAFGFDIILGILGIGATLTAANEFPHKHVQNDKGQSGTLHHRAIVTQSEMMEHAFYQGLNLLQAIYLHMIHQNVRQDNLPQGDTDKSWKVRLGLLWLATSPWLLRRRFPLHKFSDNWNQNKIQHDHKRGQAETQQELEILLYRIKKSQYLVYKHVILHGINIYMAVTTRSATSSKTPPYSLSWRIFWLLLNTSYAMEFFLQSLVKRRVIIGQSTMLWLQRWLMTSASAGAAVLLWQIAVSGATPVDLYMLPAISVTSLILNFKNRHHDVLNTMVIAATAMIWRGCCVGSLQVSQDILENLHCKCSFYASVQIKA
jgi:hypothetical protein